MYAVQCMQCTLSKPYLGKEIDSSISGFAVNQSVVKGAINQGLLYSVKCAKIKFLVSLKKFLVSLKKFLVSLKKLKSSIVQTYFTAIPWT